MAYDKDAAKYALTYSTISAFEQDSTPRWFQHFLSAWNCCCSEKNAVNIYLLFGTTFNIQWAHFHPDNMSAFAPLQKINLKYIPQAQCKTTWGAGMKYWRRKRGNRKFDKFHFCFKCINKHLMLGAGGALWSISRLQKYFLKNVDSKFYIWKRRRKKYIKKENTFTP